MKKNLDCFKFSFLFLFLFLSGCSTIEAGVQEDNLCQVTTIHEENIKASREEISRLFGEKYQPSFQYRGNSQMVILIIDTLENNSKECNEVKKIVNSKNQISTYDTTTDTNIYSIATDTNLGVTKVNNSSTIDDDPIYRNEEKIISNNFINQCSPLAYRIYTFENKKNAFKKKKILQKKFQNYKIGVKYYKNQKKYKVYIWGFESKEEILPFLRELKIQNPKYIKEGLNICNGSLLDDVKEIKKESIQESNPIVSTPFSVKKEETIHKINEGLLNMCKPFEDAKNRLIMREASQRAIDKTTRDLANCLKKKEYFETLK